MGGIIHWLLDFICYWQCPRCSKRKFKWVGSLCWKCYFEMVRTERKRIKKV